MILVLIDRIDICIRRIRVSGLKLRVQYKYSTSSTAVGTQIATVFVDRGIYSVPVQVRYDRTVQVEFECTVLSTYK